jgi:hypothetical protein
MGPYATALLLDFALVLPAPIPPGPGDAAWKDVKTVDGVRLMRAPSETGAPWGSGEADITAPLERVIAHLTDFIAQSRKMPRLAEVRVLDRSDDSALVYFRFDLPWPVSDRDWTVRYTWQRQGDHFLMSWVDANDRGPPPSGALRVSPIRGYWDLIATGAGTTRGRYVFLAELGGSLPRRVREETVWKQPLGTLRGVRDALR